MSTNATDAPTSDAPVKVGGRLAFRTGYDRGDYVIHAVTKITGSGRIVCGPYTLNPNLTIRGERSHFGPSRGEYVTPKILAAVERQKALARLRNARWQDYDDATLAAVCAALAAAPSAP